MASSPEEGLPPGSGAGPSPGMVFDHIGVAVKSIGKGVEEWRRLFGYEPMTDVVRNTRQKVQVIFLGKPGSPIVKLFQPDPESPAFPFAARGGGLHHLCFRCPSLGPGIEALKARGARLVVPPEPGEAFEDADIAFLLAGQGLNIELIDTVRKAALRPTEPSPPSRRPDPPRGP